MPSDSGCKPTETEENETRIMKSTSAGINVNVTLLFGESLHGLDHLHRILEEAQTIVSDALAVTTLMDWIEERLGRNHDNIHVRGYEEEGIITTPFDMTVLNDLDRLHLVIDSIGRLPQTGDKGICSSRGSLSSTSSISTSTAKTCRRFLTVSGVRTERGKRTRWWEKTCVPK